MAGSHRIPAILASSQSPVLGGRLKLAELAANWWSLPCQSHTHRIYRTQQELFCPYGTGAGDLVLFRELPVDILERKLTKFNRFLLKGLKEMQFFLFTNATLRLFVLTLPNATCLDCDVPHPFCHALDDTIIQRDHQLARLPDEFHLVQELTQGPEIDVQRKVRTGWAHIMDPQVICMEFCKHGMVCSVGKPQKSHCTNICVVSFWTWVNLLPPCVPW